MKGQKKQLRSARGFSLAMVLIIGLVCTLLVTAMFGMVMPSYNRISSVRAQTAMRSAAEAGIDWAVAQFNLAAGVSNPSFDAATYGTTSYWSTVPTAITNPSGNDTFAPFTQIQVNNAQPTNQSYVYNWHVAYFPGGSGANNPYLPLPPYQTSYVAPTAGNPTPNGVTQNQWRVISVRAMPPTTTLSAITVGSGGNQQVIQGQQASAIVKNLQVVLKPNPPTPFTLAALLGNSINFNGANYVTDAYNSANGVNPASFFNLGGDLHANDFTDLGNSTIKGNVDIRDPHSSSPVVDLDQKSGAHVNGIVSVNNTTAIGNSQVDGNYVNDPTQPVSGTNPIQTAPSSGGNPNKINQNQNNQPWPMPNVSNHPTGSSLLSAISNSDTTIGPGQVIGSGGPGANGEQPSSANPANYYMQASGTEISLTSKTLTVTGPTRLYLEGNTNNTSQVMKVSGQGNIVTQSQKPSDFILFYNGPGELDLTGLGTFYGVIVAPNATVKFAGNAAIYGAVVGNVIGLNGGGNSGAVHYDEALSNLQITNPTFTYEAISWREF